METRFWNQVKKIEDGCWLWLGSPGSHGYGMISRGSRKQGKVLTHRYVYELTKSKIPKGLVIDHLCMNKLCVNPEHLEAVTQKTNFLRGSHNNAIAHRLGHCIKGHSSKSTIKEKDGKAHCLDCRKVSKGIPV